MQHPNCPCEPELGEGLITPRDKHTWLREGCEEPLELHAKLCCPRSSFFNSICLSKIIRGRNAGTAIMKQMVNLFALMKCIGRYI